MKTSLEVACIQFKPILNEVEQNVKNMCNKVKQAVYQNRGVELIVFPELAISGYECGKNFETFAENIMAEEAKALKQMKRCAKENNVYIIYGFPERKNDGKVYNSQVLIDRQGEVVGSYQKIHLFDTEKKYFTAGNEYKVFNTPIGNIGLFICYDAFFPEMARILTLKGADVLVNSTNWELPYDRDMDLVMRARAIDNTIYLVCSNRIGKDINLEFFGHSQIINPLGDVTSIQTRPIEDILCARIDFEFSQYLRKHYYSMLSERRTDIYQEILNNYVDGGN